MNARTHGLTAETMMIGEEDPAQFRDLCEVLQDEFTPSPGLQQELVDRMAGQLWRLRRAPALEAAALEAYRNQLPPSSGGMEITDSPEFQAQIKRAMEAFDKAVEKMGPRRPLSPNLLNYSRNSLERGMMIGQSQTQPRNVGALDLRSSKTARGMTL